MMANLSKEQREAQVLTFIADYQPVSARDVAALCKSGYSTATSVMRELKRRRLIQRSGEPRWPPHWKTN